MNPLHSFKWIRRFVCSTFTSTYFKYLIVAPISINHLAECIDRPVSSFNAAFWRLKEFRHGLEIQSDFERFAAPFLCSFTHRSIDLWTFVSWILMTHSFFKYRLFRYGGEIINRVLFIYSFFNSENFISIFNTIL